VPGIKVDASAHALAGFPGEKVTEGLDGLRGRLKEYFEMGARFAKWRAVIIIGDGIPTGGCLEANSHALARYAALCQEAGIVPIVEPEVLMDGAHTMQRCAEVTEEGLVSSSVSFFEQRVDLRATILKPNMVLPGKDLPHAGRCRRPWPMRPCACCSSRCRTPCRAWRFSLAVSRPSCHGAAQRHARAASEEPVTLTFSYSRATQQPALDLWAGKQENVEAAQKALYHRARLNGLAQKGEYKPEMEKG